MQSKPCVAVTQSSCNASSEVLDLLHLPLIHMQALAFDESVLEIEYDWLILTSKHAVDLFMKYKNKVNNCKIASIGEKTTERIKSYGLSVDFEPSVYTQEGFIDEFNVTQSLKVLYPTSKHARNHLYNYLKENHCMVKKIELYEPVANAESIHNLEKNIDDIEGLTVSSSSSARILCQYFSYEMLYNKIVIAIGAVTASTLEDCGIKAEVSQKETLESMIDLLEELI